MPAMAKAKVINMLKRVNIDGLTDKWMDIKQDTYTSLHVHKNRCDKNVLRFPITGYVEGL